MGAPIGIVLVLDHQRQLFTFVRKYASVASGRGLTRLLFPRVAGAPRSCRGLCPREGLGRNTHIAQFTPDPANCLRLNNFFNTLASCLATGTSNKVICLEVRSASGGERVTSNISTVVGNFGSFNVAFSRNIANVSDRGNSCNPCARDGHRRVCGAMTGDLILGKLTCPYFYATRRLATLHSERRGSNTLVENCFNGCTGYHGLACRRVRGGVGRNGPCILHFHSGNSRGGEVIFSSVVHNGVRVPRGVVSRILLGDSNVPACRFTRIYSSRFVHAARIVENRR